MTPSMKIIDSKMREFERETGLDHSDFMWIGDRSDSVAVRLRSQLAGYFVLARAFRHLRNAWASEKPYIAPVHEGPV